MDMEIQTEILLRQSGYETWPWSGGPVPVVSFENATVVGFVHLFATAAALLDGWEQSQEIVLARHAAAFRMARDKAWNVYSAFLTKDASGSLLRRIERIEEDFTLTRKIARGGLRSPIDLRQALLPLTEIRFGVDVGEADYEERLRARMTDLPLAAVNAFLGPVSASDVLLVLADAQ